MPSESPPADQILTQFREDTRWIWSSAPPAPQQILYHYTSPEGLIGILAAQELWASNVLYLNDASEIEYGRKLISDVIADYSELRELKWLFADGPENAFLDFGRKWNAYVTCFCANGDLLSQWRAYASMGGGYAVGFDLDSLRQASNSGRNFGITRVEYEERRQTEMIRHLAEAANKALASLGSADEGARAGLVTENGDLSISASDAQV